MIYCSDSDLWHNQFTSVQIVKIYFPDNNNLLVISKAVFRDYIFCLSAFSSSMRVTPTRTAARLVLACACQWALFTAPRLVDRPERARARACLSAPAEVWLAEVPPASERMFTAMTSAWPRLIGCSSLANIWLALAPRLSSDTPLVPPPHWQNALTRASELGLIGPAHQRGEATCFKSCPLVPPSGRWVNCRGFELQALEFTN